ncbi:hypothetical protein GCM10010246_58210 [Streptomyces cuspidosporus]|uniref:Uncharacterized protein n=1 Tax=Streptomyces cuspidosporus TaxID=66882 RepID=A0ABP5TS55_9ACTN
MLLGQGVVDDDEAALGERVDRLLDRQQALGGDRLSNHCHGEQVWHMPVDLTTCQSSHVEETGTPPVTCAPQGVRARGGRTGE